MRNVIKTHFAAEMIVNCCIFHKKIGRKNPKRQTETWHTAVFASSLCRCSLDAPPTGGGVIPTNSHMGRIGSDWQQTILGSRLENRQPSPMVPHCVVSERPSLPASCFVWYGHNTLEPWSMAQWAVVSDAPGLSLFSSFATQSHTPGFVMNVFPSVGSLRMTSWSFICLICLICWAQTNFELVLYVMRRMLSLGSLEYYNLLWRDQLGKYAIAINSVLKDYTHF